MNHQQQATPQQASPQASTPITQPVRAPVVNVSPTAQQAQMKDNEGFAKLRGQDIEYYLQKLSVTLGRTMPTKATAKATDKASSVKALLTDQEVDVPLGEFKNISRLHARITYNFTSKLFELFILSKNGAKVNGKYYNNKSAAIQLRNGTEVQLGDSFFIFQLPSGDMGAQSRSPASRLIQQQQQQMTAKKSTTPTNVVVKTQQQKVPQSMDKPNVSYATMIAQALASHPNRTLSLQQIYQWISDTYPYYTQAEIGWKSSVRHNLSHSKFFHKVPAEDTESNQRGIYTLNPEFVDDVLHGTTTGRQTKKTKDGKTIKIEDPASPNVTISKPPTPKSTTKSTKKSTTGRKSNKRSKEQSGDDEEAEQPATKKQKTSPSAQVPQLQQQQPAFNLFQFTPHQDPQQTGQ
jgi:hypothetical protein